MNREFLLTVLIVLTVALSVSTIYASEVNVTDTYAASCDDMYVSVYDSNVDNDSSNDNILKSENSDYLSTNTESNSLLGSDDNANVLASSSENSLSATSTSTITSSDLTKYYKGPERYVATFYDKNGNLLKNTDVTVKLDGKTYTLKTNSYGNAGLTINLKPGTYKIIATNPVTGYSLTKNVNVLSTIISKNLTKYYKGSPRYMATFRDSNGVILKNTNVTVKLDGRTHTLLTNIYGKVGLTINLKPGTYEIVATNPVNSETLTNTIKVLPTISSKNLNKYYKGSQRYTATFHHPDGDLLNNTDVQLTINTKTYTVKTNAKGVAGLTINLKPGTYPIVATNPINGETLNTTVKVLPTVTSKDLTKYYKGSAQYSATFHHPDGDLLKNTDVQLTINTKTYTVKTNEKGVAGLTINLNPGTYQIVAKDPNTDYSITNNVKVLSTIINNNDITKVYSDGKCFSATFLKNDGTVLANKAIKFKVNDVTYTRNTDDKGIANVSLTTLPAGTHKIISYNTDGLSLANNIKVVQSSKTTLKPYDFTFYTSENHYVRVQLLNEFGYSPDEGKDITFEIDGKSYTAKTNDKGVAYVKVPSLKEGNYNVNYTFAGNSVYGKSNASNTISIIPSKTPTFTVKSETTMGYGVSTPFKVALTSGSVPLIGKTVTFTINGATYVKTTNANGIASLPINLLVGKYTISYTNAADSKINSKTGSSVINVVKRTKPTLTWKSPSKFYEGTNTFSVQLLDSSSKAISGATVNLVADSKNYSVKTTSDGYANFNVSITKAGSYAIKYSFDGDSVNLQSSGSKTVTIEKPKGVSMASVISAAATVKNQYSSTNKFPDSVTVDGVSFTMPEFLYVMSQAICQLNNSDNNAVAYINGVSAPGSSAGDTINANLYKEKYVEVANNIIDYIATNNKAPTYASSDLGKIGYYELVDAFSRVVAFYGSNDVMPNYVTIKPYNSGSDPGPDPDPYSQTGSGLNEKNTVSNLEPYLKSSTNCPVNDTAIKEVVDSLTSGLTTPMAKAKAIYNYVRDKVSYSFYYDTRYGAVGTLNAKTGNCVDQSHLLIAMYRTAGLPARYVHGAGCTFSSGTYGHVWAQVLIDGNWIVSDPTSSRNSFGKIVNWNTNSFTLKGIYSGIQF